MSYWKTGRIIQKGKYIIEKVLGVGGAGITYAAKNVEKGNTVAIKTLNATIQAQSDFPKHQERFIQEAFRLAKCNHAHIIRVDDVCRERELWCMVMEYIDGGNLESLVKKKGGLNELEAIRYMYHIGTALSFVHKQSILHRDVKPANIMLRHRTDDAILIDFGLARDFIEDKTQMHTNSRTEGFAPLEQYLRNAKRGAYTDVYALAATLYYTLTLQIPFPAQFRSQGISLIPPVQHNPSISHRTNLAILKGMELKPENRPQSMDEWLNMLTEDEPINFSSSEILVEKTPVNNVPVMVVPLVPVPVTKKVRKVIKTSPMVADDDYRYDPLSPHRFENIKSTVISETTSIIENPLANSNANEEKSSSDTILESESSIPVSEVGINYDYLDELLKNQQWQKADEETHKLMLKAVKREHSGFINGDSMANFPCRDLNTIDQLWTKYSTGRFGFSVQKRIYLSLGGKSEYDKKVWEAVGDRLGWRINGTWLFQDILIYNMKAPQGHLPTLAMSGLLEKGIYTLIARIIDCHEC